MGKNVIISTLPNISQNYLPKVNTSNIFANSLVYDDGSSVLINTTTASAYKLDVNGTGRFQGALTGTSATFSSSVTAGQGLFTSSSFPLDLTANTNNYGIRLTSVQAPTLLLYSTFNNANNRNWGIYTNYAVFGDFAIAQSNAKDGDLTTGANGTARLYIKNDGNVGIGTTSPDTYSYGGTRKFLTLRATLTNEEPFLQLIANGVGNSLIDFGNATIRRATIIGLDGSHLAFYTNGSNSGTTVSERMRITSDGYLRLVTKGIQFNNDTADANSLDDYEEGTWTPTIEGDGSNPTLTYSTQVGRYTKIGRVVTIHCALQPNSTSVAGTGILRFGGLPFTSANIPDVIGTGVANSNGNFNWGTGKTSLIFSVGVNTTKISVFAMQNGTVEAQIPVNNFNNSSQYLLFSITYITAS